MAPAMQARRIPPQPWRFAPFLLCGQDGAAMPLYNFIRHRIGVKLPFDAAGGEMK
jgi:hypothetical protein